MRLRKFFYSLISGDMSDVAIKFGQDSRKPADTVEMGIVTCDTCAARFTINQDAQYQSMEAAERQATWLERRLTHDHEAGLDHDDAIDLPGFSRG